MANQEKYGIQYTTHLINSAGRQVRGFKGIGSLIKTSGYSSGGWQLVPANVTEVIQNALEQAEAEGQPVQDIVEAAMNGAEVRAEVNGPEIIITAEDGAETAESTKPEEAPQEYSMALYYHVTGEQRKALVTAVSAFVDAPAVYQNAPTFAYAIGEYRVDKEGTLTGPASEALVAALQAKEFMAE